MAKKKTPSRAAAPAGGRTTIEVLHREGVALIGLARPEVHNAFNKTLVAELTARHLGFGTIFSIVAVPGLVATVALVIKQWAHPQAGQQPGEGRAEAMAH